MIPCDELGVHDDDLHVLQTVGRAPDADVAAGTLEHRVMRRGQPLAQIGNDPLLHVAWCLANACATEWSVNEYDPTRIDVVAGLISATGAGSGSRSDVAWASSRRPGWID